MSLTVRFSGEAEEIIRQIADRYGITLGEAVARALANQAVIAKATKRGGKVLVEKHHRFRELRPA